MDITTNEKVIIQVGDEFIELQGTELEEHLAAKEQFKKEYE
jgi:hypothetical protein